MWTIDGLKEEEDLWRESLLGAGHSEMWTLLNQRIYLGGRNSKLSEADQKVSFSK